MGPPVNEFAIENVQDEIAHQAPKRRKVLSAFPCK
jgi:hypothetical protein